jgi:signal transduction histidine kinase
VSLGLDLRAAQAAVPTQLPALGAQLGRVAEGLGEALEGLRELSRGIHPAILSEGGLRVSVGDDGIGGADPARGSGLIGLSDRAQALGGTLTVRSPAGQGTTLLIDFPVEVDAD